jgi:hypothetical protein
MAKREYIQANKDWLEAKAKEEGVKALPKGIYCWDATVPCCQLFYIRWPASPLDL